MKTPSKIAPEILFPDFFSLYPSQSPCPVVTIERWSVGDSRTTMISPLWECLPLTNPKGLYPPAAYIIGAPKCGTTALAAYLADHPDICFSDPKEPHFFADDMEAMKVPKTEAAYRAVFPEARSANAILMEGSVFYLLSQVAISRIQERRPDAKFIVMLRDPVLMAPSMHRQVLNSLDEDIQEFDEAWRLSDARGRGEKLPPLCRTPDIVRYPVVCALGAQLQRLYEQVPRERVLVMLQDELREDAGAVYRRALAFLGLPDDGRTEFPRINEANAPRSRLLKMITQRPWPLLHAPAAPIKRILGVRSLGIMSRLNKANTIRTGSVTLSAAMAAELGKFFRNDVALLSDLLDRDLVGEYGWLSAGNARSRSVEEHDRNKTK